MCMPNLSIIVLNTFQGTQWHTYSALVQATHGQVPAYHIPTMLHYFVEMGWVETNKMAHYREQTLYRLTPKGILSRKQANIDAPTVKYIYLKPVPALGWATVVMLLCLLMYCLHWYSNCLCIFYQ